MLIVHTPNDQRHPDDLDRLRHPDEARSTVLEQARPLAVEHVSLIAAMGRAVAETIVSPEDHPPFAASTMDGYAVIAEDRSPWREVVGEQMAGNVIEAEVTDGTAIRIMTGAPIPRGANAVIRVENTEMADSDVVIHQDLVAVGENIRPVGSDIKAGTRVLEAGTILGPAELGLLASLGVALVPVRRKPRVSILSTGDELVEPGQPLGPGQIRDSNRYSLMAALSRLDVEVVWQGIAPDERDALTVILQERIADSDVVITSGGVSMGELDLVKVLLGELATVHFRRVFLKPGKPLNFATSGKTLIFGLPGNPVSALVSFELFIRPALAKMTGRPDGDAPRVPVTLLHDTPPTDRIEFQRAKVSVDATGRLVAQTTGGQQSSRLASFTGANALLVIPPRGDVYRAGETVDALLLGVPGSHEVV